MNTNQRRKSCMTTKNTNHTKQKFNSSKQAKDEFNLRWRRIRKANGLREFHELSRINGRVVNDGSTRIRRTKSRSSLCYLCLLVFNAVFPLPTFAAFP